MCLGLMHPLSACAFFVRPQLNNHMMSTATAEELHYASINFSAIATATARPNQEVTTKTEYAEIKRETVQQRPVVDEEEEGKMEEVAAMTEDQEEKDQQEKDQEEEEASVYCNVEEIMSE
uniref:Uncharacterized protein n=1 Tax=Knipowitschia caucasica TaxID=637954 RepID=A0AAV2MA78_KNICA